MNYISKFDIVCLTETFADSTFDFSRLFTDHVKFAAPAKKLSLQGRNSGGVLLLIRKSLSTFVKQMKTDCENTVVVRVDKSVFSLDKDVLLIASYVAPENSPLYDTLELKDGILILEESILQMVENEDPYILLCGDLNARTGCEQPKLEEMSNYTPGSDDNDDGVCRYRCSKDSTVNNFGKSLLNLCFMLDCVIVNGFCNGDANGEFTYVSPHGSSVIDYFIISEDLFPDHCELRIGDRVDSWHLPVEFKWKQAGQMIDQPDQRESYESCIVWSEDCLPSYKQELESDSFKRCMQDAHLVLGSDLDDSIEIFQNALYGAAACMVRKRGKKKKHVNDWFDDECAQKKKTVKRALKRFQRSKKENTEYRETYVSERKEYKQLLARKKTEFDRARIARLKQSINDPKLFWQTIRSVNRKVTIYNDITKEQWYEHFFRVFNTSALADTLTQAGEIADAETDEEMPEVLFNEAISKQEVVASIGKLKSGKSAGPDKIIGEMLKHANEVVIDFLVKLFNEIFDGGMFPREWSKSIIVPIHKKGDVNQPDNYRGIALTSVISKVYTNILNKRLSEWAEVEEKIIEEQAGFRAGYSTVDHIFSLYAMVQKYLLKHTKLYVAFVDFKKAFDSVNTNALWSVLRKNGVNGKLYMALRGIYNSVIACVRDKCSYSDYFACPGGVKQGCLLSPLMFSFFINELAIEVSKTGKHGIQLIPDTIEIFLLLFADDVILLSNTIIGLQNQLDSLKREADRLYLTVNLEKTNIMVFRMGGHLAAREKWLYGNAVVKVTNAYKYLGMIFTTKLSVNAALSDVCKKGKKGVMEIQKSMRRLSTIDPCLFWKLFDAQITPILTYAAEVWGLHDTKQIEKVHTFAIKRFLNVPLHCSNKMIYGETGRYPLFITTYVKCIKFWLKLTRLPMTRICRQAYEMLLLQHETGKQNWVTNVKTVLVGHGFGIVWLCQSVGYETHFVAEFKDRLICCYKQNWHSEMESDEKYRWFYSFKCIFQAEKYLMCITNKWLRGMYARFRLRACGLKSHKQWFSTEQQGDFTCPVCGQEREDEIHFIFHCQAYTDLRKNYSMLDSHTVQSGINYLRALLASKNETKIIALAKYITEAMKVRRNKVENI